MKLSVAIDYDNTWSSAPDLFAALGKALRKQGATVTVLTANPDAEKALEQAGVQKSYDAVVAVKKGSTEDDTANAKEAWLAENKADLLIDNNVANCIAASRVCDAALFFPKQSQAETKSRPRPAGVSVGVANFTAAHRRSTTDTAA